MLQAKKRFWGSRPGFDMGDILHIGVNAAFALVIYATVVHWALMPLAIILVFLSKWRVLAVQPRFWFPNIKANLVDIVVGISIIGFMQQAAYAWIALIWAAVYLIWLLFIKPQTSEFWVGIQALMAQLLGLQVMFVSAAFIKLPLMVVILSWVISWAAARHFFSNYEEPHYRTLGIIWGLLVTELAWVGLHWIQYYIVFDTKIAIIPLVVAVIMGTLGSVYHSYKKETLNRGILIENGLFASAILVVLLLTAGWTPRI